MYYITNHNDQVIAASSDLLELLEVESIDALYRQIALDTIEFRMESNGITLKTPLNETYYKSEKVLLSSLLGSMTLVRLLSTDEASAPKTEDGLLSITPAPLEIEESGLSLESTVDEISIENETGDFSLLNEEEEEALFSLEKSSEAPEIQLEESILPFDTETPASEVTLAEEEKEKPDDAFALLDDEALLFEVKEEKTKEEVAPEESSIVSLDKEEEESETSLLFDDEALFEIKEDTDETELDTLIEKEPESQEKEKDDEEDEDDLFNLILPSNAEERIEKIEEAQVTDTAPISIDIEEVSQKIGISSEDYSTFLTEYIDTALSLENDLRGNDQEKKSAAAHSLIHLSNVLRLPQVTEHIEAVKEAQAEEAEPHIQRFYNALSKLTTTSKSTPEEEKNDQPADIVIEDDITIGDEISIEAPIEEEIAEEVPEEESEGFGTIDLSDVKPIHFDFRVEEAADDLSLPAELIEEFIHDFIEQAHEETDKMLEAYKRGDLDTIQKIGHLLKGTASNLRIVPLSDTLYEIQFCEDPTNLESLIREYWAHFIAFETQFNLASQH